MKITFDKQVEMLAQGFGELDNGERPPFIQCDIEKVYTETVEGKEVVIFEDLANKGFTRQLNGVDYYLINSYNHIGTISGNPSGLVDWKEGQIPTEEIQRHMDVFGADNTIMYDDFVERKSVELMWETLDGSKEAANTIVNTYFDDLATKGFMSDCLGESKLFDSDEKSVAQIAGQVTIAQQNLLNQLLGLDVEERAVSWRESGVIKCYPWTTAQMIALGGDLGLATQTLEHAREELLDGINNCTEVDQVKAVLENVGS